MGAADVRAGDPSAKAIRGDCGSSEARFRRAGLHGAVGRDRRWGLDEGHAQEHTEEAAESRTPRWRLTMDRVRLFSRDGRAGSGGGSRGSGRPLLGSVVVCRVRQVGVPVGRLR